MKCEHCDRDAIDDDGECNRCWELRKRVEADPDLARKFLGPVSVAIDYNRFTTIIQGGIVEVDGVQVALGNLGSNVACQILKRQAEERS